MVKKFYFRELKNFNRPFVGHLRPEGAQIFFGPSVGPKKPQTTIEICEILLLRLEFTMFLASGALLKNF